MDDLMVVDYILKTFPEVETTQNFGYTFFFYRSERMLPFATFIDADTDYDRISNLNRPGVFRLNIGVSRETFQSLFGAQKVDVSRYDYTSLDVILPHPDYARQHWICVLSPGTATLESIRSMLAEAYEIAVRRFNRQHKKSIA